MDFRPLRDLAMMAEDTTQYKGSMETERMVKAMERLECINTL